MSVKTALGLVAVAVIASGMVYLVVPQPNAEPAIKGSLFVSDAGQSHGGFEYTASYNVTLNVKGGAGIMTVVLDAGLGDLLARHVYVVRAFQMTADGVSMQIDGSQLTLPFVSSDTVWNHTYDNSYIASWGSTSPPAEIRGTISPAVFSGMPSTYYVELRIA